MKKLSVLAFSAVLLFASTTAHAIAYFYTYANNDAEYTVDLLEPPKCVTIWGDDKDNPVPYLDVPPRYGSVGEKCTVRRVDPNTGDIFEVNTTFLKADREFLISMTREKMEQALQDDYKDIQLDQKKIKFSAGTDTLKWGTLTGFSVDENNNFFYNATHYLTGAETIMIVQTKFNIENKSFHEIYKAMAASIKYSGK